mmetsp:Transcript_34413/g.87576  ORF Transcript_34413/g.87576 Transcript_34413/m.87576 type:complete len:208 (-) Transcript_34413:436-1059(-)
MPPSVFRAFPMPTRCCRTPRDVACTMRTGSRVLARASSMHAPSSPCCSVRMHWSRTSGVCDLPRCSATHCSAVKTMTPTSRLTPVGKSVRPKSRKDGKCAARCDWPSLWSSAWTPARHPRPPRSDRWHSRRASSCSKRMRPWCVFWQISVGFTTTVQRHILRGVTPSSAPWACERSACGCGAAGGRPRSRHRRRSWRFARTSSSAKS